MDASKLQALNFKVSSIETFIGVPFRGETIADKEEFVAKHWDERVKVTDKLLKDSYDEYLLEHGIDGSKLMGTNQADIIFCRREDFAKDLMEFFMDKGYSVGMSTVEIETGTHGKHVVKKLDILIK